MSGITPEAPPSNQKKVYWEEFTTGRTFDYGEYPVTAAEIIEFGKKFDPLPQHLDEEAAKQSPLGVLCASGIHAMGMSQKLLAENLFSRSALIAGRGLELMTMHSPIVPGDRMRVELKVDSATTHASKPDRGWVELRGRLYRTDNSTAMTYKSTILFLKRPQ